MPRGNKCLLGHVLGRAEGTARAVSERTDEGLVAFDDPPERLAVAFTGQTPELFVGCRRRVHQDHIHHPYVVAKAEKVTSEGTKTNQCRWKDPDERTVRYRAPVLAGTKNRNLPLTIYRLVCILRA